MTPSNKPTTFVEIIYDIARLTHHNQHSQALRALANYLGLSDTVAELDQIIDRHKRRGGSICEVDYQRRHHIQKAVLADAASKYSPVMFDQIRGAL